MKGISESDIFVSDAFSRFPQLHFSISSRRNMSTTSAVYRQVENVLICKDIKGVELEGLPPGLVSITQKFNHTHAHMCKKNQKNAFSLHITSKCHTMPHPVSR